MHVRSITSGGLIEITEKGGTLWWSLLLWMRYQYFIWASKVTFYLVKSDFLSRGAEHLPCALLFLCQNRISMHMSLGSHWTILPAVLSCTFNVFVHAHS